MMPTRAFPHLLWSAVLVSAAIGLSLTAGTGALLGLGMVAVAVSITLVGLVRVGPQFVLIALLGVGYFSGWIKIRTGSWIGYVLPDALCLLLLAYSFIGRPGSALPLPRNGLTVSVLWLSAFCLMEFINPESPLIRSLAGFRSWIVYTWLIFAGYHMLQSRRQLQQIYGVLLALSIITALYGIYQWQQGPAALMGQSAVLDQYATKMDWTDQQTGKSVFRAFSTFGLPGAFGHNMAMGLLVAVVILCTRGIPRYMRWLSLMGAPLMLAGLAASGARSPAVMLAVGLLVITSLRGGRVSLPLALLLGAGVWATASLITGSVATRYASILDVGASIQKWWLPLGRGLTIAAENPFGKGLGYTAGMPWLLSGGKGFAGIETTNVDSGIGVAAAELGFIGLAIFLLFLFQLARRPLQVWRQLPEGALKDLLLAPVTFSLVFALTSVITVISASLPFSIYMWLLIGMVFKAPYLPIEEQRCEMPGAQEPVRSDPEPYPLHLLPGHLTGRLT